VIRRWQNKYWKGLCAALLVVALVAVLGFVFRERWFPGIERLTGHGRAPHGDDTSHPDASAGHDHGGHGHGDHEVNSIELSEQARKNVGLRLTKIELRPFARTISVPAMVVERPGRSQLDITAPFTGVVTSIYHVEGEAIRPDQRLFTLRMTHEDLVTAQADYLRVAEELDVVGREVARLESVTEGVIAGKTLLTRKYERQKLQAALRAQHQRLLLHALTEEQVDQILETRSLLQEMTIVAPKQTEQSRHDVPEGHYHIRKLYVREGQHVDAGQSLCVLGDHCELFIEGRAFEEDADRLSEAAEHGWNVSAVWASSGGRRRALGDLKILYLADAVESDSRAFPFYVLLPNRILRDVTTPEGQRFVDWRYKPGQRLELLVPIERPKERIVLPIDAVVREGAESFVLQQNGDLFQRVSVHVEYRDRDSAVIANDGSVFPGDTVVTSGAFQIHLAIKNQSGVGIDPHAGHGH